MTTTEKRPVGRPARDPFAEQRVTLSDVEFMIKVIRGLKDGAGSWIKDMRTLRGMFEGINQSESMDETAKRISGIASGRMYFAQHFYPEFMVSECEYMLAGLNQLRIYLESQTPALRKEEKV